MSFRSFAEHHPELYPPDDVRDPYPSMRLARENPGRSWGFERCVERSAYLVRLPSGALSYVETGDQADRHPGLVGHLKVRRTELGLRVGAALREDLPDDVLARVAREVLPGDDGPVVITVWVVP